MSRGKKLDEKTVRQIRELLCQKVPYAQIHESLGVSKGVISKIANPKISSSVHRMNDEPSMNHERTLNVEQLPTPISQKTNRPALEVTPIITRTMNDEQTMNLEPLAVPIDREAHPISTRQMIDECLDIAFDITWNRGSKKVKLKKLQGNLCELREQLPE